MRSRSKRTTIPLKMRIEDRVTIYFQRKFMSVLIGYDDWENAETRILKYCFHFCLLVVVVVVETHSHTYIPPPTHPREIVQALYPFFSCCCYCCHRLSAVFCCCLLKGPYAAIENAHVVFSYVTRLIVWHICKLIKIVRKEMNCSNADNFIVAHTSFFPWFCIFISLKSTEWHRHQTMELDANRNWNGDIA